MMSESYHIIVDNVSVEDVVRQLRGMNTFPCTVNLYDRIFVLANKDEAWALRVGVEVGWFLCADSLSKEHQKKEIFAKEIEIEEDIDLSSD